MGDPVPLSAKRATAGARMLKQGRAGPVAPAASEATESPAVAKITTTDGGERGTASLSLSLLFFVVSKGA